MVQPINTQSTPSNSSQLGPVTPQPAEQIKTSGIKPSLPNGITAAEEDNAVTAENEQRDIEQAAIQRQLRSGNATRGSNLDITV